MPTRTSSKPRKPCRGPISQTFLLVVCGLCVCVCTFTLIPSSVLHQRPKGIGYSDLDGKCRKVEGKDDNICGTGKRTCSMFSYFFLLSALEQYTKLKKYRKNTAIYLLTWLKSKKKFTRRRRGETSRRGGTTRQINVYAGKRREKTVVSVGFEGDVRCVHLLLRSSNSVKKYSYVSSYMVEIKQDTNLPTLKVEKHYF